MPLVLTIRGAGEGQDVRGMCSLVVERLQKGRFVEARCRYPAALAGVGGPGSLESSVRLGVADAVAQIRAHPGATVIVSYSLGGIVASTLLEELASGQHPDILPKLRHVINIANPARRAGESNGIPNRGHGLYGQRRLGPRSIPVTEIARPDDAITSAAWDSPLRRFADLISPFSVLEGYRLGDPNRQRDGDAKAVLDRLKARERFVKFWEPRFWQKYVEAAHDLGGYLAKYPHGTHTNYLIPYPNRPGMTYIDVAAEVLNRGNWT